MTKPWHPRAFRGGKRKRLRSLDEFPRSPNGRPPRRRKSGGVTLMAAGGVSAGLLIAVMMATDWGANAPVPPGDRENPALVRVIDGDTFDYRGVTIRVADIDTPEVRGNCAEEIALAARATRRMRNLIAAGPFTLHPTGDGRNTDDYGRSLRIVTRGGRSLGDQLVAEGLARTWSGRRDPWC